MTASSAYLIIVHFSLFDPLSLSHIVCRDVLKTQLCRTPVLMTVLFG